jgi:tungstate transport system substrate-binding protein
MMYNDFVIVGPKDDPANIRGVTDAAKAYRKIALTGSLFFSRGDNSGTHQKEMSIWKKAGITPTGDWYKVTGDFMGATLKTVSNNQGYFMTDRSSYIKMEEDINLEILSEGDPDLINRYSAIAVNPQKHPGVNYDLAKAFIEYVVSPEGQAIIRDFGKEEYGEPLYYPAISKGVTFSGLFEREVTLSKDGKSLGAKVGDKAFALVKATEVMVGKG